MSSRLATVVSFLFHPLFIPLYVLAMLPEIDPLYKLVLSGGIRLLITGTVTVTTVILPLLILLIMLRLKLISSLYLPTKEDRFFPLMIMALFYYLSFFLIKELYLPKGYLLFLLGSTVLVILCLLITLVYRISLHTTSIGGATGFFVGLTFAAGENYLIPLIVCILLSGLIGWARLYKESHQPSEIYSGWLMGALVLGISSLFL
jgi:membrane-associated phospholipid phosphatase